MRAEHPLPANRRRSRGKNRDGCVLFIPGPNLLVSCQGVSFGGNVTFAVGCSAPRRAIRYGAKYARTSTTRWTGLLENELMEPFAVGTIAMLEVTAPSSAFKVATPGWLCPC